MIREVIVRHIGFPVAEKLKGWPVSKYLRELERSQWLSPEEITKLQNEKLAEITRYAYDTVPFYKRLFNDRGMKPSDVQTIDDLPRLPILTKEDMRKNLDDLVSSDYKKSELVEASSSGSTGEPFQYYISEDEKARKWAGLYMLWNWAGFKMGDRHINFVAGPHRAFKSSRPLLWLESKLSGMRTISALELYEGNADEFLKEFARFKPKMIRGYASSLYYLAQSVKRHVIPLTAKAVCTTGETLFEFQRELIESVFKSKVYDGYGGEGMVIAGQCGCSSGYHINAADVILEIVDSSGRRCPPGVQGQVVLTDLNRHSMPFIRYNVQDVATFSDAICSCGRGFPMLSSIAGRLTDIGVTPSGKSIVVHFFTGMFMKMAPHVNGFQVVQEQPGLFVLNIVPGIEFETVRQEILDKTCAYVGSDVDVQIQVVDHIPATTAGKRRLFISKCGIPAARSQADIKE